MEQTRLEKIRDFLQRENVKNPIIHFTDNNPYNRYPFAFAYQVEGYRMYYVGKMYLDKNDVVHWDYKVRR